MHRVRCSLILLALAVLVLAATAALAYAFDEPNTFEGSGAWCAACHANFPPGYFTSQRPECQRCHGPYYGGTFQFPDKDHLDDNPWLWRGPHGMYLGSTNRCKVCHTLHGAPSGNKLLPKSTTTATCFACHDGTGGMGVYGTIEKRGLPVGGSHHIDTTSTIPGGSALTGGDATATFVGANGKLGCDDCHSPHDANTVVRFLGDRARVRAIWSQTYSTKLLKQKPTGATTAVAEYGSDWCLACHKGRNAGGAIHNHPVDSLATTSNPFVFRNVAALQKGVLGSIETSVMGFGNLGAPIQWGGAQSGHNHNVWDHLGATGNGGFLMLYPRRPEQAGHGPICQQCHEDSRDVGYLTRNGNAALVATSVIWELAVDGVTNDPDPTHVTNPKFQNFPHETQNADMLVETGDNLCLNCHPTTALP